MKLQLCIENRVKAKQLIWPAHLAKITSDSNKKDNHVGANLIE
jgi:hypothetical protein